MKRFLCLVLLSLSYSILFADLYEIVYLSTPSIIIGGVELTEHDVFLDTCTIEWSSPRQFMRVKNSSIEGAKVKKFYQAAFEEKKATSIFEYYQKINHLSTMMGSTSLKNVVWHAGNNKDKYQDKRMALVIGNSDYSNMDYLVNPVGDAILVTERLQDLGFDVASCYDGRIADMKHSLNSFCEKAKDCDVILFYYAGHGLQDLENSINYMLPIDMNLEEDYVNSRNCLSGLDIRDNIQKLNCKVNILLFDACRSDYDVRGFGSAAFTMEAGKNTVVMFSTSNGTVAYDGYKGGNNGLFATAFLENVGTPGVELSETLKNIQKRVYTLSEGQRPSIGDNVMKAFYFEPIIPKDGDSIGNLQDQAIVADSVAVATMQRTYDDYTVNGVSFRMIRVPGGTFQMGATEEQETTNDNESPVHAVALSDYCIGETEVTQALWVAVMGKNPSHNQGDRLPVERVSWNDCQKFIKKLNQMTGQHFRLPTEAEWEFAARGGNISNGYQYSGGNIIINVARYELNSGFYGSYTQRVKSLQANELCLYDMSGNVSEWCQDGYGDYSPQSQDNPLVPYSGKGYVFRGGSIFDPKVNCRVSYRSGAHPEMRLIDVGLRLAL